MDEAIAVLKAQGAVIVDPADIPSIVETDPTRNFLNWGVCAGSTKPRGTTPTARSPSSTG